ncbi:hypothetical protein QAO71_17005 (plasmid) [Halopseudomonas sp. SMJS2]|uniref:hypothetical protein n=1 Tax=Halopseudomonas sp. SMJS2 TaxID=3041098 RepID=UPI002453466D|nr:hypothetical protein [Halopseudomonas sp. SMJS2]WGK63470.1 hypothetical protein QAO71_17005 [Halopseudomonas sp. SMJS2]
MSLAKQCFLIEMNNRAAVMAQTFGHMEAEPGTRHPGWFTFITGQHGDNTVIESDFPTFDEGPGYFMDRDEFIWSKVKNNGPASQIGVYRFEGEYRRHKICGEGLGRFVGKVTRCKLTTGGKR